MHGLLSRPRSRQPTPEQHAASDATPRASSIARFGADRTVTPTPTRQPDTTADRLLPRVTRADIPDGARPRRGPKADETEDEPEDRRPNQTAAVPGHRRPLTAARAGAEGADPSAADHPPPRRSAPRFRAYPQAHGHRAAPNREPRTADTTADRLLPRVRRADISDRWPAPRRGPKADKTEDEQRTPHRIRPPPSQVTADFPRQRARKPKAPTPHRPPPAVASAIPRCVFHAHPTTYASLHESSRTAQHRNLMRRAAGRGRSGDPAQLRTGPPLPGPDGSRSPSCPSSSVRRGSVIAGTTGASGRGGPRSRRPMADSRRPRVPPTLDSARSAQPPARAARQGIARRGDRRERARPGARGVGPELAWRRDRAQPGGRAAGGPGDAHAGTPRGRIGGPA